MDNNIDKIEYLKIFGTANDFSIRDLYGDLMNPRKFDQSIMDIKKRMNNGHYLPLLIGHDVNIPIGKITQINMDKNGINIEGEIYYSKKNAQYIINILNGSCGGLSIGFMHHNKQYNTLLEVSITPIPANPNSRINKIEIIKKS